LVAEDSPAGDPGEAALAGEKPEARAPPSERSAPRTCRVVHGRGSAEMHFGAEISGAMPHLPWSLLSRHGRPADWQLEHWRLRLLRWPWNQSEFGLRLGVFLTRS